MSDKNKLREAALKNRDKIHNPQKGLALRDNFLRNIEIPHGSIISAYWPIGSEIDARPLISELYNRGYDICLPCVEAKDSPLSFRQWEPNAVIVKSPSFKIFEPCKNHHDEMIPNVLIVPLVAFDKARHRLGYGGGFYDRTIEKLSSNVTRTESRQPAASGGAPSEEQSDGRSVINKIITIGIAYSEQEIDKIPNEDWDVQLDKIITENKIF